ncbi:smad nuclear-interacting protein 1 [Clarias gariepinus]|uniref:smad nuclear-interacting protein 1 n=1 Tax=Clarias gariepinus TaxID=13013 RepID=UPI00234D79EB|nr:smad nuclear-interacting protein 1 [Clarias gariepinus]
MDYKRRDKRSPVRDGEVKIKQEKLSPARPRKSRRSSSGSDRSSTSPPPRRREHRSPVREKDRSPGRRERLSGRHVDRSARDRRSRSPPHGAENRINREQEDHNGRGNKLDERRVKREEQRLHQRDRERGKERHRDRSRERDSRLYQQQQAEREQHNEHRRENRQRQEARDGSETRSFGGQNEEEEAPAAEKEMPNFELSGALVEDTNTYKGVVIKYNEPPEARIPKRRWRLYPFKNDEPLPVMYIHRQSAYLLGRQRKIADIPIDHPSCSKQHAVFQYRLAEFTRADGTTGRRVKPYIIDLASGNGTYLNNQRIEPQRYYELKEKDVLKFGFSSREYVLLHEFSDTAEVDAKKDEDDEDEGLDE